MTTTEIREKPDREIESYFSPNHPEFAGVKITDISSLPFYKGIFQ